MPYSKYTDWEYFSERLGIEFESIIDLIKPQSIEPSEILKLTLETAPLFPLGTDKAKTEQYLVPILAEIVRRNGGKWAPYSGFTFNVDEAYDLTGVCDFLIGTKFSDTVVLSPILAVVEAKKDDIYAGEAPCAATMEAIRRFNLKHGKVLPHIWGSVTTGFDWRFMQLKDNKVYLERKIFQIHELPQLLGALQYIADN